MMPIAEYCKDQTDAELQKMVQHVKDKPRWELTEASYVMLQAAIKELIRRKLIVYNG